MSRLNILPKTNKIQKHQKVNRKTRMFRHEVLVSLLRFRSRRDDTKEIDNRSEACAQCFQMMEKGTKFLLHSNVEGKKIILILIDSILYLLP